MVITRHRHTLHALSASVLGIAIAGCGGGTSQQGSQPQAVSTAQQAVVRPSDGPGAAPMPQQFLDCGSTIDESAATELVAEGLATALVRVTIKSQPGDVVDNVRNVPVAASAVLAGSLNDGDLEAIQEADQSDTNSLPPGDYAVLLGETGVKGTYFLSDGLRGSFALSGDQAQQQCPTIGPPTTSPASPSGRGRSAEATGAPTMGSVSGSITLLTELFRGAFAS